MPLDEALCCNKRMTFAKRHKLQYSHNKIKIEHFIFSALFPISITFFDIANIRISFQSMQISTLEILRNNGPIHVIAINEKNDKCKKKKKTHCNLVILWFCYDTDLL